MDDTTETPEHTPYPPEGIEFVRFTARIPVELMDWLRDYAESLDWSTNSALINSLQGWMWTVKNKWIEPLTAIAQWDTTDEARCAGARYEVQTSFNMPNTEQGDSLAYATVDSIDELLINKMQARDVTTRVVKLQSMVPRMREAVTVSDT